MTVTLLLIFFAAVDHSLATVYLPLISNPSQPGAPTITTQPVNQTVTEGQTAIFSVTATGAALTYQWQRRSGSSWANVTTGTGGTTASYTTVETTATDTGAQFRCLVTNTKGSVASNAATLTVNLFPL